VSIRYILRKRIVRGDRANSPRTERSSDVELRALPLDTALELQHGELCGNRGWRLFCGSNKVIDRGGVTEEFKKSLLIRGERWWL
jgi:hypothetical protein